MLKKASYILALSAVLGLIAGSAALAAGQASPSGFANDSALQMAIETARQMLKGTRAIQATSDVPAPKAKDSSQQTLILGSPEAVPM